MTKTLAELVSSRICHDLINPIGAISNGLELLSLSPDAPREEIDLIDASVRNASARIRFFRIAYGSGQIGQSCKATELSTILSDISQFGKISYAWDSEPIVDRQEAQTLFLFLQCLETNLPFGGSVVITYANQTWTITADGERVTDDLAFWEQIKNQQTVLAQASNQVQFALLQQALKDQERVFDFKAGYDKLTLTI